MNHSRLTVCGVLVLAVVAGSVGVTAAQEEPLADAGLDQSVQQNSTVYLDAGGSVAPDGEIVGYQWEIERPEGTTTTPACPACEETSFQATDVGVYDVTVTVTDDSGRTASDTLYVTVAEHTPPNVSVTGPDAVSVDENPTVWMNATAGDEPLSSLVWFVDGQQYNATFLDGDTANESITPTVSQAGEMVVETRVTDRAGGFALDRHTVQIQNGSNSSGGDGEDDGMKLRTRFTGTLSGVEGKIDSQRYVYEGDTFSIDGIGFEVYDSNDPDNEVIESYPFTQSRAEVLRSTGDTVVSDPHDWTIWGPTPGLSVVTRSDTSMKVKATSPQDGTEMTVKLKDVDGFGYHGYPEIEIREADDQDPPEA